MQNRTLLIVNFSDNQSTIFIIILSINLVNLIIELSLIFYIGKIIL